MIAASIPRQRPSDARLLAIRADGELVALARTLWTDAPQRGDLVVANDAATLPASLRGVHTRTGAAIEVRLAGRRTLDPDRIRTWTAVVFGSGDWRTRTEDRAPPPTLRAQDTLKLGSLVAKIVALIDHARLATIEFDTSPDAFWQALAIDGRPIQYAHLAAPLALWDVQTPIAGPPVALEPPSAGFALDWRALGRLRHRGVGFATLTHAAGLSSTGDPALDARFPLDEPYTIPAVTAAAIGRTRRAGGRIFAIGTTVVRALEHAASRDGLVRSGDDVADNRISSATPLRVVDALVTGAHEPGTSHYELLRAFASDATLARAGSTLDARGFRTHEFGDSVLIERAA